MSSESLMDASNLAIVLAPNIMRPHIDIKKVAPGNPIKNLTGQRTLIDPTTYRQYAFLLSQQVAVGRMGGYVGGG